MIGAFPRDGLEIGTVVKPAVFSGEDLRIAKPEPAGHPGLVVPTPLLEERQGLRRILPGGEAVLE